MIDKATVDRIHNATNIVDVVSDFVSLKKRGSSYLGLCPFHNERTPSFSVSPSLGIFKCFSCGKAGSPVTFLMDLEGMTYVEALKWLGKKYGIEVEERELSAAEREIEAERESLLAVNDFALNLFERNLSETEEGRNVGLSYFRERGVSDQMIKKFHLGYALEKADDLLNKARAAGFAEKYLVETGLEVKTDRGLYDRFKGRVIFPIHSLSGRVVAFGGRKLSKEKTFAKYVNSPESAIYSKSNELYGMYQARSAIAKKKECILVEGYMDVISMHQSGVENVVASSGTSLTEGQIRMIKRFADTVTLIYDSDPAGIKASLRGINMFVAAGLNLRLVLLPEGDDPDSFAQSHSSTEVEAYIAEHSQNLIGFKSEVLLAEAGTDPRARGEAINDVLQTIALVPDLVEQSLYIDEFAKKTGVASSTLAAQLKNFIAQNIEKEYKKSQQQQAQTTIETIEESPHEKDSNPAVSPRLEQPAGQSIMLAEEEIIKHVLRHGLLYLCDVYVGDSPDPVPMSVVDYIECDMRMDNVEFSNPLFRGIWAKATELRNTSYAADQNEKAAELERVKAQAYSEGLEDIRNKARDHAEIVKLEAELKERIERDFNRAFDEFSAGYIRSHLLRDDSREVLDAVAGLTSEPVVLSKMYPEVDVRAQLKRELPIAINTLKSAILKEKMRQIMDEIGGSHPPERITELLRQYQEMKAQSMEYDRSAGEIVITPK